MSDVPLVELQAPSPEELAFVEAYRERFEQAGWKPGVVGAVMLLSKHPVLFWPQAPALRELEGLRIEASERALVLLWEGRWSVVRVGDEGVSIGSVTPCRA